ncbi:MAG: hypothetical protein KF795_29655 [Labilithrix sp.]|nr:hypothetical protein [Labilithrix sp.]
MGRRSSRTADVFGRAEKCVEPASGDRCGLEVAAASAALRVRARHFAGMHIIIGMPPHIIIIGAPMAIIAVMASQRSFMRGIIDASIGVIFIIMPSFVISQDILHIIGIMPPPIMGIIIGIIMPFIIGMFMGIIIGIMPPCIGIPPCIGMPVIPPCIGMPVIPPCIGICIGIMPAMPLIMGMLLIGMLFIGIPIIGIAFMDSSSVEPFG